MRLPTEFILFAPPSAWRRLAKMNLVGAVRKYVYWAYLQSGAWKQKRARVFERENGVCQRCHFSTATEAHHTTYQNFGDEPLCDLEALCKDCHDRHHSGRPSFIDELLGDAVPGGAS